MDDTRATIPELKLRWDHEFSRDDYGVNASFAGRPASSFYENTLSRSETLHTGELGMEYRW